MQKILYTLIGLCSVLLFSCNEDTPIGPPLPIEPDYPLPQGNASQVANSRIQEIYDIYGSYLLYEFTDKDLNWSIASGSSSALNLLGIKSDPEYVEDMVKLLDEYWLQYIPDHLLKGKWLPYRVFMADTIKRPRLPASAYSPMQRNENFFSYNITGMSLAISGVNIDLRTLDAAEKKSLKNKLQFIAWKYYSDKKIIDVTDLPEEWDKLADYTTAVTVANAPSRGFIPQLTVTASSVFNLTAPVVFPSGVASNWFQSASTRNKENDVFAFITQITQKTDEEIQPLLDSNPVIRQKYDIIIAYILEKYGIDIRAIGNANAEIR
ncbi:hypothetical protein AGMMS50239_14720 [Bacteroidia bacterium]|nr:hypothetical protein AGMMS50239_14720 [Bacteroidia bacterium]